MDPIGIEAAGMFSNFCLYDLWLMEVAEHDRLEILHRVSYPFGKTGGRGLKNVSYCVWISFEVVFVYFMFPETSGRTLEELTFCEC